MDFGELYNFLFETYAGIGVLVAASLVLCIIVAAVLELRTRKTYVDRGEKAGHDAWSIFDDEDDEDDEDAAEDEDTNTGGATTDKIDSSKDGE